MGLLFLNTEQVRLTVTPQIRVREVLGLNLGRDTGYPD
jgi:hypothetical protein